MISPLILEQINQFLIYVFQIIDVKQTTATMAGTKVEVKMKKAEPGSWSKLFFPREVSSSLVN